MLHIAFNSLKQQKKLATLVFKKLQHGQPNKVDRKNYRHNVVFIIVKCLLFYQDIPFSRYLNDLYTLDLSQHDNLQWDVPCTYGQPPTPRESHSAVLHTAENGKHPRLFIYGGMSGCRLGDVFILDVGKLILIFLSVCSF